MGINQSIFTFSEKDKKLVNNLIFSKHIIKNKFSQHKGSHVQIHCEKYDKDNISIFFMGIFDAHGKSNKDFAYYIRKLFVTSFNENVKLIYSIKTHSEAIDIFHFIFNKIESICESSFDYKSVLEYTGCCVNLVFIFKGKIINVNLGDSKVMLLSKAYKKHNTRILDLNFTNIHKREDEKQRLKDFHKFNIKPIPSHTHIVYPFQNKIKQNIITRCIGNINGKNLGVIHQPEVTLHKINKDRDLFIVAANGKFWETIDNYEIFKLYNSHANSLTFSDYKTYAEHIAKFAINKKYWNSNIRNNNFKRSSYKKGSQDSQLRFPGKLRTASPRSTEKLGSLKNKKKSSKSILKNYSPKNYENNTVQYKNSAILANLKSILVNKPSINETDYNLKKKAPRIKSSKNVNINLDKNNTLTENSAYFKEDYAVSVVFFNFDDEEGFYIKDTKEAKEKMEFEEKKLEL